ncbi:MAG: transcriptional regulator PpsR [Proteobacteria bacterium]|nr:transcriptional regulator PpsR [Pseudomonadota bacterium]
MRTFRTPRTALGAVDAEAAASLVSAAADIALILDQHGVIKDVSISDQSLADELPGYVNWLGKAWAEVVTEESRPKISQMLADALAGSDPRWRHLNHPTARAAETGFSPGSPDIPILYAVVQAGNPQRLVAFGRDLRAVSSLQRRLIDAQQSMERDYARIRHVETRYRLLFQMASDAVLIVDGSGQRVLDSNPTAKRLLPKLATQTRPWQLTDAFSADTARSVELLLAGVRTSGRADDVRARLAEGDQDTLVSASLFRDENGTACLVRIATVTGETAMQVPKIKTKLLKLMENAPDAFVVADTNGQIMTANGAFIEMAQLPTEEQSRGQSLGRWLGRTDVEIDVLTANLRQYGSVRLFASQVRGELGETSEVEVSAVSMMNGGQPCFGFAIRDVGRRLQQTPQQARAFPKSLEHMTELIGRVALKDLVREATDVIERLCIEAALNLTGDNRASAAEMLGLSRQSLYVKLRRYGLGEGEAQGAD